MRTSGLAFAIGMAMIATTASAAQEAEPIRADRLDSLVVGTVIERIIAASDSSKSYAVYLPSRYDPERSWPILFVMDPRGRALLPLERLIEPAERYGYIVMSSYDTASDYTGPDPNEPALDGMLEDAQTLFALDPRRLYLVGFSGTARASWALGLRLMGHLAGIIGVGGGMQHGMYQADLSPLRQHPEFGFYGLVGTRDFNYDEMRTLEVVLDRFAIPNGLSSFDGPHGWAPAELLARAVAWMELRAMQTNLRPVDRALVDSLYQERMARARALEEAGRAVAAYREYDSVADDYGGLLDVVPAQQSASRLRGLDVVKDGLKRANQLRARFWEVVDEFGDLVAELQAGEREPDPDRMADDIALGSLLAEAADTTDEAGSAAAIRVLEHIYVYMSFYLPRAFIDQDRTEHALAVLALAERIFPERPRVCHFRARAFVAAGRTEEALDAVRCALAAGLPAAFLERDPELEPLRELPAFTALIRDS